MDLLIAGGIVVTMDSDRRNPKVVSTQETFEMATIRGARTLLLESQVGSLDVGQIGRPGGARHGGEQSFGAELHQFGAGVKPPKPAICAHWWGRPTAWPWPFHRRLNQN